MNYIVNWSRVKSRELTQVIVVDRLDDELMIEARNGGEGRGEVNIVARILS